jgi:putative ABC transport system ATP-binding protein
MIISINQLNHYFGEGVLRKQALFDINLEIKTGEIVIMTGPSGSGKTTLLTLMGGLRSAQDGSLKILEQERYNASKRQLTKLRRQIGYIFQAHNLMTFLTAKENVRMSLELHDEMLDEDLDAKAIAILEKVGLGNRVDYYPESLSGGQKQRVAIAYLIMDMTKPKYQDERCPRCNSKDLIEEYDPMTETALITCEYCDFSWTEPVNYNIQLEDGTWIKKNECNSLDD